MTGSYLRFYVQENQTHHGVLVYEWLLEHAQKIGIRGGSAFRAIAGYGRLGVLHESRFFELQGDLPIEVVFVLGDEDATRLLAMVDVEQLSLFYTRSAVEFAVTAGAGE